MTTKRFSPGRTWRRMRTVPGLGGHVASLVVFVALAVVVTGVMIGQSNATLPWSDQTTVKVEFDEVPGVTTASSQLVRIAGVEVGQITGSEATDHGTAVLTLTVEGQHKVYDNAHAVLRAVNPLNQMFVELNPGGPPGRPLGDGDVIPIAQTSRPVQADEVLSNFDQPAQLAIQDLLSQSDVALANAPQQFPQGIAATDKALVNLRPALEALATREEKLGQLVTSLGQIAQAAGGNQERALRLADATEQTLGVLAANDEQLRDAIKQLPGLYEQLTSAFDGTQRLTEQLDPTLDSLNAVSEELPGTLERLTETSATLGETVDAAQPVVTAAQPLVADLRPLVADVDLALDDILPITEALDADTRYVVDYLTEIQGFVYNTSSVFGIEDARAGIIRGHAVVPLPDGNALPGAGGGYAPTPEENGLPPIEGTN